jgi:hypothetical protein
LSAFYLKKKYKPEKEENILKLRIWKGVI